MPAPAFIVSLRSKWRQIPRRRRRALLLASPLVATFVFVPVFAFSILGSSNPDDDFPILQFDDELPTPLPLSPSPTLPPVVAVNANPASAADSITSESRLPQDNVNAENSLFQEQLVAQAVAATLAAGLPTPGPTPTPDVSATVMARSAARSIATPNPFERHDLRSPYLSEREVETFSRMGGDIFRSTLAYLELRKVADSNPNDWNYSWLKARSDEVLAHLAHLSYLGDSGSERYEGFKPLVVAYIGELREGIREVLAASNNLNQLSRIYGDAEIQGVSLSADQLATARELRYSISQAANFYELVLSRYGCSICGEMLRRP